MTIRESTLEDYIRRAVERRGGRLIKLNARLYRGIPDRLAVLPGGRCAFLELKRPSGGVLSPSQGRWLRLLWRLEHEARVLDTHRRVDQWLDTISESDRPAWPPLCEVLWTEPEPHDPKAPTGIHCLDHPDQDKDPER